MVLTLEGYLWCGFLKALRVMQCASASATDRADRCKPLYLQHTHEILRTDIRPKSIFDPWYRPENYYDFPKINLNRTFFSAFLSRRGLKNHI